MEEKEKKITSNSKSPEGSGNLEVSSQETISTSELDALISLLTGEQKIELEKLRENFNDPELFTERIKETLPEAIARRGKDDQLFAQLLAPTIEETIDSLSKQDPDALAAKMLPTIRRSVRLIVLETFNDLLTNLNRILDHSFNLSWRLEAWRTGRPFSEIVLAKTLIYRVEQIFLIHTKTGILLKQVIIDNEQASDGDLISGMLTAIRDFVHHSFEVEPSETLSNFKVGELSVLIEQDEEVFIAAVVRGLVPAELNDNLQRTASLLQMRFGKDLKDFTGDTTPFGEAEGPLKACLTSNFAKPASRPNFMLWIALAFISIFLLTLSVSEILRNYNWSQALNALEGKGGIVVTKAKRTWNTYQLRGLLDPLAERPSDILLAYGINPDRIRDSWEAYHTLDETIILKRVKQAIKPPPSVTLSLQDGILKLTGSVSNSWREVALQTTQKIIGIERVDTSELYSNQQLDFNALIQNLESEQLYFKEKSDVLIEGQEDTLNLIKQNFINLHSQSLSLGYDVEVLAIGYGDDFNCKYRGRALAVARAWHVLENITEDLPIKLNIRILGLDSMPEYNEESSKVGKVSFKVSF